MNELTTITDIQKLAMQGFTNWQHYGDVNVTERGDLLLFDYTTAAHIANRWNFFERVCRGLIINRKTGEVVARPFDKFFYWIPKSTDEHIVTVMEKMDGSLGILFRHKGEYHVTTKGSFFSSQGRWATHFLRENFDLTDLPDELTLLFEIIYPDNRIIVDYEGREDLVLLAARNRLTGEYLPFFPDLYEMGQQYGFSLPLVYQYNNMRDLTGATGGNEFNFEGWVVEFSDGRRVKVKMDRYVEQHKLIGSLTFPNVLAAVRDGHTDYIMDALPAQFAGEAHGWVTEIFDTMDDLTERTLAAYTHAPKTSRAEFERWASVNHPDLKIYLLGMLDEEDLPELIFRHAFVEQLKGNPIATSG